MSYSKRSRYSSSPSYDRYSESVSRSLSRSRSISRSRSRSRSYDSTDVENPGNSLYVTGLSSRTTRRDLEKHFSSEGTVEDVRLVIDPRTRESRGFGFVTMSSVREAERCIKYLDRSVLGGRVMMVEKATGTRLSSPKSNLRNQMKHISDTIKHQRARRRRGRTPTPGRYLGLRNVHGSRSRTPRYSRRYRSRSRSYSPYYRRRRSYSRSRSSSYSRSPIRRDRSYSPYYSRRSRHESRSITPSRRRYSRSYSRSYTPRPYRRRRSYSRSVTPRRRRSYSRSLSPSRSYSRSSSPRHSRRNVSYYRNRRAYDSRSPSVSASSRSVSRSRSASPSP